MDVKAFELRPITILVGRNSSGKSTFLRALPLLRQSITTRTSSPILWFGDWVDFGDFEHAVRDHSTDLPISFSFGIDSLPSDSTAFFIDDETGFATRNHDHFGAIRLTVSIVKSRSGTRLSRLILEETSNGVTYDCRVSEDNIISSLIIDGSEMIDSLGDWVMVIPPGSVLPSISFRPKVLTSGAPLDLAGLWDRNPIKKLLGDVISPRLDKRTKGESLGSLIGLMTTLNSVDKDSFAAIGDQSSNRSWKKLIRDLSGPDKGHIYQKIRKLLLVLMLRRVLNPTVRHLQRLAGSILYIGPARARSDRYYRYQDLAVSEIDPDGKNFPMFLNSLSDSQMQKFSTWVRDLFGYGVKVGKEQGHITINLVYDNATINIVDTGYGVSQILPVLGQVWWANNKPRSVRSINTSLILAIEQPELHLHPAHQALLADAFVSGLRSQVRPSRQGREDTTHFVLETHSETMINRLGELISSKRLASTDVQILLFHADESDGAETRVEAVFFDDEGQLRDWPYDFFLPVTTP